jgi:DNA polymerase II large subunit
MLSYISSSSSRDFIHNILCTRPEGFTFYQKTCLDGTCPRCGGMTLLRKCIHVSDEYELGRKEVTLQRFKYVTYDIDGGQERKNIQLVTSQV